MPPSCPFLSPLRGPTVAYFSPPSSNGIISSSRLSFVRAHVHSPVSRESRSTDNGRGGVGWPGHWARVTLHCPKAKKRRGAIAQLLLLSLAATKWPSRTTTRRRLIEGRRHGLAARIRGRASTRRTMAQNKSNRFFFFFYYYITTSKGEASKRSVTFSRTFVPPIVRFPIRLDTSGLLSFHISSYLYFTQVSFIFLFPSALPEQLVAESGGRCCCCCCC